MVIDELIVVENGEQKFVDSADNKVIDVINYNKTDYHFARENEVPDGVCENAVSEPIIDVQIKGNSIQDGEPSPETPVEIESVGNKTKNLFNIQLFIDKGATKEDDGSYYFENAVLGRDIVVWENKDNYEGQLTISYKVKYGNGTQRGNYFVFIYEDDTSVEVWGRQTTEYFDVLYTSIKDKKVTKIQTTYGTTTVSTNFMDVQIEYGSEKTEYEPYGYKVPINVSGKNLINYRSFESRNQTQLPLTINDDGSLEYVGNYYILTDASMLKSGETYTFSCEYETQSSIVPFWRIQYADGTYSRQIQLNTSFTLDSSKIPNTLLLYVAMNETIYNIIYRNIQLEIGEKTDYEPYFEPTTTNIYLTEPLRKVGDYADYIDYKNKKVVRKTKQTELTGDESFTLLGVGTSSARAYTVLSDKESTLNLGLCSHFKKAERVDDTPTSCDFKGTYFRVNVSELNISTVSEWNEYLKTKYDNGTPVEIVYLLATPTEETVSIPEISTADGTNIVAVETTIEPSELRVGYWKQIMPDEVEEEITDNITQTGSNILIISTGAEITQSGTNLTIGG